MFLFVWRPQFTLWEAVYKNNRLNEYMDCLLSGFRIICRMMMALTAAIFVGAESKD
jgi:hypothetical protein